MPRYTPAQLAAIEIADAQRRLEREIAELQAIATRTVDPYLWGRSITGEPSAKNRQYRASDDCWKRGLANPSLGWTETPVTKTKIVNTVKLTRDGKTTIEPASKFRKTPIARKQREHVKTVVAQRRSDIDRMADMGTIHQTI